MKKFFPICLVIFVFAFTHVAAQDTQTWTPAKFLGDGWWESLTLDQENNLHVAWYGEYYAADNGHDVLYYRSRHSDGTWSDLNDIIDIRNTGYTIRNSIATTSNGMLHVAFRSADAHNVSSAPIIGAFNPRNWSPWTKVGPTGYYLDMIAGSDDTLHLVLSDRQDMGSLGLKNPVDAYAEGAKCFLCFDLFYRRSTDGGQTWSDIVPISINTDTGTDRPTIQQGRSGKLYINWDEGVDWNTGGGTPKDVRLVISEDQGLTWSAPILFDGGGLADRKPIQSAFTEMRDGSLMMVWRYSTGPDRHIYYQLSSDIGKTWTTPTPVPGIFTRDFGSSSLDHYALVTDRLGMVHLFAVGQSNLAIERTVQLYDVTYVPSSQFWIEPQRIYYNPDERPEWPEAVVGPANDIHLVWFNRGSVPNSGCNTCLLKVYYSYLPGNIAPEPTRAFKPTFTPMPTATVFVNYDPTTTPFSTLDGVRPSLTITTVDNYASQTFLSGMFISALFCGVIFVLLRLRR